MFETGGMHQPHEEIEEKCAMFIGAFHSCLERDGKMTALDEIPDDWAIGSPYGYNDDEIEAYARLFGREKGKIQPR